MALTGALCRGRDFEFRLQAAELRYWSWNNVFLWQERTH